MRKSETSKRLLFTCPNEIRSYLLERARYHGSSLSNEICRAVRERMEREAIGRERKTVSAE